MLGDRLGAFLEKEIQSQKGYAALLEDEDTQSLFNAIPESMADRLIALLQKESMERFLTLVPLKIREQVAQAFDLFYTTKEPGKGTGLGLSIVHDIVTRHHGELEFLSSPGQGTTVRLVFPAHRGEPESRAGSS